MKADNLDDDAGNGGTVALFVIGAMFVVAVVFVAVVLKKKDDGAEKGDFDAAASAPGVELKAPAAP